MDGAALREFTEAVPEHGKRNVGIVFCHTLSWKSYAHMSAVGRARVLGRLPSHGIVDYIQHQAPSRFAMLINTIWWSSTHCLPVCVHVRRGGLGDPARRSQWKCLRCRIRTTGGDLCVCIYIYIYTYTYIQYIYIYIYTYIYIYIYTYTYVYIYTYT